MLASSPIAGKLFDIYDPSVPLAARSILQVFGLMMTSLSTKHYHIMLSQSICSGVGTSLIFTPAMIAVRAVCPMLAPASLRMLIRIFTASNLLHTKRGIVGGLTSAGSSLGGVIFALIIQHLVPQIGSGWTMRACALLVLGLCQSHDQVQPAAQCSAFRHQRPCWISARAELYCRLFRVLYV